MKCLCGHEMEEMEINGEKVLCCPSHRPKPNFLEIVEYRPTVKVRSFNAGESNVGAVIFEAQLWKTWKNVILALHRVPLRLTESEFGGITWTENGSIISLDKYLKVDIYRNSDGDFGSLSLKLPQDKSSDPVLNYCCKNETEADKVYSEIYALLTNFVEWLENISLPSDIRVTRFRR